MSDSESKKGRSAKELRASLDATRDQIDGDLTALGDRIQESVSPLQQLSRHPLVFVVAGTVVGFLLIRKPAMLLRAAGRLAKWGAPVLLSTLLRQGRPRGEIGPANVPPSDA